MVRTNKIAMKIDLLNPIGSMYGIFTYLADGKTLNFLGLHYIFSRENRVQTFFFRFYWLSEFTYIWLKCMVNVGT